MSLSSIKQLHKEFNPTFCIQPHITVSLLLLYTIISGIFGYLLGVEIFSQETIPGVLLFEILLLRLGVLTLYAMANLFFLYLMIGWFRKSFVQVPVLLSYYLIFTTGVFILTILMFLIVWAFHSVFSLNESPLLIVFGISLVIIFTLLNLYPGYLFYLAIRHRPIDTFWPIILYVIGIHLITFIMLRLWNAVDLILIWNLGTST
ncbi:hypothetical protein [Salinicoccus roseus]|uniref:hypothetical protein n=1 Tax=Salinicoccus roseus TaxID=45670 RepID=UPI000F4D94F6|nr:hypothetical protein [Salinicoccus roseus]RPE52943.1 hypothetical protein EDC33_1725 [Salinicoccus roseus]GGA72073.1 hypothetical protein GCM10007176_15300 [Salinicoccus roseus]